MAITFYLLLVVGSFFGTTYAALSSEWAFLLPVLVMFGLVPLLDEVWKRITHKRIILKDSSMSFVLLPLYVYFTLHFLSLGAIIYSTRNDELGIIFFKTLASLMFNGGQCVVIGHEFCHLPKTRDKLIANLLFSSFMYGHFVLEHVQGHHVHAATSNDPSSARLGEGLWRFLPRTIWGQLRSVINIEKSNLKKGRWKFANSFFASILFALSFLFISFLLGGVSGVYFFLVHSLLAILLLEAGNYVVHYGLSRKGEGLKFEKFKIEHAWSSDSPITNLLLFNLPHHSSHHLNPQNNYLKIVHDEKAPCLPYSHFIMLILSLYPPLWFKVMHPVVSRSKA